MSTFADYTFYKAHGGELTETAYNASVDDAHTEIISQTMGAALTAPDSMLETVKLCECALVDLIAGYKETSTYLPKGINSVNNDGFSISAGTGSGDSATKAEIQERRRICVRYLQYPVNLMCRWV